MSINECLKGTKDLKKLQAELIAKQMQNQERHAKIEPLQDQAAQLIMKLEEEKKNMEKT
jgi:hypothetical protein